MKRSRYCFRQYARSGRSSYVSRAGAPADPARLPPYLVHALPRNVLLLKGLANGSDHQGREAAADDRFRAGQPERVQGTGGGVFQSDKH